MSNNKKQTTYTSKELREMKEKKKQEELNKFIYNFTNFIVNNVLHQASESEKTSYVIDSYSDIFGIRNYKEELIIEHKELIIEKLKERFTDARIDIIVCCKVMVNNTLVEIEKLHESVLKLVDKRVYKAKLVIDWSEKN